MNRRGHFWSIVGHHVQGAICGAMTPWFPAAAAIYLGLSMSYQWAGWAKYHDSVKRDVRDYIVGYALGLAPALAWRLFTQL